MILIPKVSRIMGWNGTMGRCMTKSPKYCAKANAKAQDANF